MTPHAQPYAHPCMCDACLAYGLRISELHATIATLTANVSSLEGEIDAVRGELMHALDALTPARRKRYDIERDERGGPLP